MDTYDWGDLTARLTKMLRLQTPPVGMKWVRTERELHAIPKIRIHDKHLPPCTIVSHAAQFNWTSACRAENVHANYCRGINGMFQRDEKWYSGEMFTGKMPQYEITALPEGYIEDVSLRIEWPNYTSVKYKNEELQNMILFDYIYMQQASVSDFVPGEDTMILPVTVNDLNGQLFLEDDWETKRNVITWVDPGSNLQFTLQANLSETDILHMAESVSLVKPEK